MTVVDQVAVARTEMAVRIAGGEFPGVELVDVDAVASQPDAPHGVNPELVDPDDER